MLRNVVLLVGWTVKVLLKWSVKTKPLNKVVRHSSVCNRPPPCLKCASHDLIEQRICTYIAVLLEHPMCAYIVEESMSTRVTHMCIL
jgi:hypothetical protein